MDSSKLTHWVCPWGQNLPGSWVLPPGNLVKRRLPARKGHIPGSGAASATTVSDTVERSEPVRSWGGWTLHGHEIMTHSGKHLSLIFPVLLTPLPPTHTTTTMTIPLRSHSIHYLGVTVTLWNADAQLQRRRERALSINDSFGRVCDQAEPTSSQPMGNHSLWAGRRRARHWWEFPERHCWRITWIGRGTVSLRAEGWLRGESMPPSPPSPSSLSLTVDLSWSGWAGPLCSQLHRVPWGPGHALGCREQQVGPCGETGWGGTCMDGYSRLKGKRQPSPPGQKPRPRRRAGRDPELSEIISHTHGNEEQNKCN